jgi:hypothetical protein
MWSGRQQDREALVAVFDRNAERDSQTASTGGNEFPDGVPQIDERHGERLPGARGFRNHEERLPRWLKE